MGTRRKHNMRRMIDVTLESIAKGEVTRELAAQKLASAGVSMSVIGRVLGISFAIAPESPRSTDQQAAVQQAERP
jgi:hypothetical protein